MIYTEIIHLIDEWNRAMANIAIMIMPALLLQKTSAKSKSRDHNAALKRRLELWKNRDVSNHLAEGNTIQKRLSITSKPKYFDFVSIKLEQLMHSVSGKVNSATRLLSNQNGPGILELTDETMKLGLNDQILLYLTQMKLALKSNIYVVQLFKFYIYIYYITSV